MRWAPYATTFAVILLGIAVVSVWAGTTSRLDYYQLAVVAALFAIAVAIIAIVGHARASQTVGITIAAAVIAVAAPTTLIAGGMAGFTWIGRSLVTDVRGRHEIYDFMNAVHDRTLASGTARDASVLRDAYVANHRNRRLKHSLRLANGTDVLDATNDDWAEAGWQFELTMNSGQRFCGVVPERTTRDYSYHRGSC